MKTMILFCLIALPATAQDLGNIGFVSGGTDPFREMQAQRQAAQELAAAQEAFQPADPYRTMTNGTQFAKGIGWVQFTGNVMARTTNEIFVYGWTGAPLDFNRNFHYFCVRGFPYSTDVLGPDQHFSAFNTQRYVDYYNQTDGKMPALLLEYGKPWQPTLTPEQIAAQKKAADTAKVKEDAARQAAKAKALALDLSQAGTNDADGLFRMGRRYLHGDGVAKDAVRARDYFGRAAAAGNETAKAELASMPGN